ncbi:LmbE family N-acetylglucosaminyl deacetylase [Microbacterium resistens]|uniref:LmbE family N-acetylglucosaminyl deacetylase n=1 Tax=Microbacterium resistens TaxID=156977 RepID=A0ABU1SH02_9MICO|nr:PIG-L family deacetylase [Microbacterium resistens]MDR6868850.1 LmbE family N-acetylglucosaminyl deacetylase [Microbacterium resistens]
MDDRRPQPEDREPGSRPDTDRSESTQSESAKAESTQSATAESTQPESGQPESGQPAQAAGTADTGGTAGARGTGMSRRTLLKTGGVVALAAGTFGIGTAVGSGGFRGAALTPAEQALAAPGGAVKLNVLFIGAHPDDEASNLAAFGQWNEFLGMRAGVITVTRGEGGGNAVGLEEGPPLGIMREAEERKAVGYAGIEHVFNLDGLDFYYTASAPLSREVWGGDAVLGRIVRVVRATRPDVIVTMNPSAVEGNHGNHQQAAMFAVEAYLAAGDPEKFPEHLDEGFSAWQPRRILRAGASGDGGTGEGGVAKGFKPTVASDVVFGCWNGTPSERHGRPWSEMLDLARWAYVTQGWAEMEASPKDPAKIPNSWFTVIHSRSPIADPRSGGDAALLGAALPIEGGLPFGTLIDVRPSRFEAVAGQPLDIAVTVTAPEGMKLPGGTLYLKAPSGWTPGGPAEVPDLAPGTAHQATLRVTPAADAKPGAQARVEAALTSGSATGASFAQVRVAGGVEATIAPLEEIQSFRTWTAGLGMKHLDVLVPELFPLGQGRTRTLDVVVENFAGESRSGTVALTLPDGFTAAPAQQSYSDLAAGKTTTVSFEVTNADTAIPTANRAPNKGNWPVVVTATSEDGTAERKVTMNLVPTYAVTRAAVAPTVDGVRNEGEYPGEPIPVETIWDGKPMGEATPTISGRTWITHDDENLYLFLSVVDDVRGTILPASDNKRQRRTDSVEIYVDPRGNAANTAHTFIGGIMPSMDSMTGAPGVGRDRDNWQGEADVTAPGMEVKVVMAPDDAAYTGYDMEVKIPFDVLPDNLDPEHVGFNVIINDSDTQNKAAQNRVGWSTFPGMRADPWRWGIITLDGVKDAGAKPKDPTLPDTSARSVASPQSILQSADDRVPLGGFPTGADRLEVVSSSVDAGMVTLALQAPVAGTARVFLWDGAQEVGAAEKEVPAGRTELRFTARTSSTGAADSLVPTKASPVLAVSLDAKSSVFATRAPLGGRSV